MTFLGSYDAKGSYHHHVIQTALLMAPLHISWQGDQNEVQCDFLAR